MQRYTIFYGKIHVITMAMFNSYVTNYQRVNPSIAQHSLQDHSCKTRLNHSKPCCQSYKKDWWNTAGFRLICWSKFRGFSDGGLTRNGEAMKPWLLVPRSGLQIWYHSIQYIHVHTMSIIWSYIIHVSGFGTYIGCNEMFIIKTISWYVSRTTLTWWWNAGWWLGTFCFHMLGTS